MSLTKLSLAGNNLISNLILQCRSHCVSGSYQNYQMGLWTISWPSVDLRRLLFPTDFIFYDLKIMEKLLVTMKSLRFDFFMFLEFSKTSLRYVKFFCLFFWRAWVCWPLLCLCRPFCNFERCLDSNQATVPSRRVTNLATHLPPTLPPISLLSHLSPYFAIHLRT